MLQRYSLSTYAPLSIVACHSIEEMDIAEDACSPRQCARLVETRCSRRASRDLLLKFILTKILMDRVKLLVIKIDMLCNLSIEAGIALLVLSFSLHQQVTVL